MTSQWQNRVTNRSNCIGKWQIVKENKSLIWSETYEQFSIGQFLLECEGEA